jgi:hypothetical protein
MITNSAYLASRYSRRQELQGYAAQLLDMGIGVTANWLKDGGSREWGLDGETDDVNGRRFALLDIDDVARADTIICFTEEQRTGGLATRGGRHVEFGAALALGKRLCLVGPVENIFYLHPRVEVFGSFYSLRTALRIEHVIAWNEMSQMDPGIERKSA